MWMAERGVGLHIQALLMGEVQLVTRSLPPECQLDYAAVSRAELVGLSPEEHRWCFLSTPLEGAQLCTYAHF